MEYRDLSAAEKEDIRQRILYEDNHLLVVNKKVGEIVQADRTGDECLSEYLKAYIAWRDSKEGKVFLGVPHRLDRPVSGVCVFAKTSKALERLCAMLRDGKIHKKYVALCCGAPPEESGSLSDYLVRNEKMNKSFISRSASNPGAKLAKLNYRYLGHTDRYHLLEVELLTGRHHQIRCQLSAMGCTIKGDLKYGAPRSNPDAGICLHAREISFIHPVRGAQIHLTAPVPASWKGVAALLPSTPDNTLPESVHKPA